uniref:C-type lectin domain-containing protein n=1 Tax=Denticeps clupeoides TaxID=299321 RepID=A0AAY4A8K8_9TELE
MHIIKKNKKTIRSSLNQNSVTLALISTALPQTYVQLGNDSLRVVTHNLTWAEARKTCEEDNAHLVSIRDSVTQAYVELLVLKLKQPMWIGLNKNEVNKCSWFPKNNLPCVYVNGGGNWQTADCNQALPSICKQSSGKDERGRGKKKNA